MTYNQTRRLNAMNAMLGRLNARCMWIMPGPEDTAIKSIQCYMIGSRIVLIEIFEEGWEYFVQGPHRSLTDIEVQLEAIRNVG